MVLLRLAQRQCHQKDRPPPQLAPGGDCPMVAIGYAAADGQTNACALVFIAPVEPLKHGKYFLQVFLLKADSIVLHTQLAKRFSRERAESTGANLDNGLCSGGLKLQSVAKQV